MDNLLKPVPRNVSCSSKSGERLSGHFRRGPREMARIYASLELSAPCDAVVHNYESSFVRVLYRDACARRGGTCPYTFSFGNARSPMDERADARLGRTCTQPPTPDTECAGAGAAAEKSPLEFTIPHAATLYDLPAIKRALHATDRPLAMALALFGQTYHFPCTKATAPYLQCDPDAAPPACARASRGRTTPSRPEATRKTTRRPPRSPGPASPCRRPNP